MVVDVDVVLLQVVFQNVGIDIKYVHVLILMCDGSLVMFPYVVDVLFYLSSFDVGCRRA